MTGRGLQLGRHEIEARFEAAQAAAPFNPVAVSEYLQNLCPKWGGSVEELLAFGRACQQAPPSHVYAYGMLPMAWLEVAVDRDPQLKVVDAYLARPKIAAELEAGAVQLLHAMGCDPSRPVDPAHPVPREALVPLNCFYLTLTKDIKYKGAGRQLAQRCRELIRGMPTELPWRYFAGGAESAGLAKVDATFFA